MALQSGFIVIGTSGKTVDGRDIKPQWLEEAAATYDPALYTAVIDLNHWDPRWTGTYGKVLEVKLGKDNRGNTTLLANIEPSSTLVEMSRAQVLFTSMSLDINFQDSGTCYLDALAVTPKPASVGTEQLMFASGATDDKRITTDFVQTPLQFSDVSHSDPDEKLFSRLLKRLLGTDTASLFTEQEKDMTEKELEARFSTLQTTLADTITAQFAKLQSGPDAPHDDKALESAKALLAKHNFKVEAGADDGALKSAQALLAANGYSVAKDASQAELDAAKALLSAQGFSVKPAAAPAEGDSPKDVELADKGSSVTREEFALLAKQFSDATVNEVNFTASQDHGGSETSLDHL
ncbi:MAG: GPO family capsid scaffolding protein [Shewanella sp.]